MGAVGSGTLGDLAAGVSFAADAADAADAAAATAEEEEARAGSPAAPEPEAAAKPVYEQVDA